MKINIERKNSEYLLEATGASGNTVVIDYSVMGTVQGVSPMELILMGLGSCSAIDIIAILKKQRQEITSYKVMVTGERYQVDDARPFKTMHVSVHITGKVDLEKAQKAAALSFEKYCSVSKSFEACVAITHEIMVHDKIAL